MSGEVQVAFINLASTIEQIKAGRLKAIATTMPARLSELPNVPTMAEQGFPGHRHERVAGPVRAGGDTSVDYRQALCRGCRRSCRGRKLRRCSRGK